jgi:hypothetical protein
VSKAAAQAPLRTKGQLTGTLQLSESPCSAAETGRSEQNQQGDGTFPKKLAWRADPDFTLRSRSFHLGGRFLTLLPRPIFAAESVRAMTLKTVTLKARKRGETPGVSA